MKVSMAENMISLPKIKTIMIKLMQSRLKNIMKCKLMKKQNNLPLHFNVQLSGKKLIPGSLQNFSLNPGTCQSNITWIFCSILFRHIA